MREALITGVTIFIFVMLVVFSIACGPPAVDWLVFLIGTPIAVVAAIIVGLLHRFLDHLE